MEYLFVALFGAVLGVWYGAHDHHRLNGTLTKKEIEERISPEVKEIGKKIKFLKLTPKEEKSLAALERFLNYQEKSFINKCKKDALLNDLTKNKQQ